VAKVTGPLFSTSASGNLVNGLMQYRTGHFGTQVHKPLNPKEQNQAKPSPAQTARRELFMLIRDSWHALSPDKQQHYKEQAATLGTMNGWNLYIAINMHNPPTPSDIIMTSLMQALEDDLHTPLQID